MNRLHTSAAQARQRAPYLRHGTRSPAAAAAAHPPAWWQAIQAARSPAVYTACSQELPCKSGHPPVRLLAFQAASSLPYISPVKGGFTHHAFERFQAHTSVFRPDAILARDGARVLGF